MTYPNEDANKSAPGRYVDPPAPAEIDEPETALDFFNIIHQTIPSIVDAAFARHGLKPPHSSTSVMHNIMTENTARDKDAARTRALLDLLNEAKTIVTDLLKYYPKFESALAQVRREFDLH